MCTSGYPHPRKAQTTWMGTHGHIHPDRYTDTSAPAAYTRVHPLPTVHSKSARPQMCPLPATRGGKREQEASPGWCRGRDQGRAPRSGRRRERRPSAPCPPARRPHRGCPSGAPWLRTALRPRPRSPRLGPGPAWLVCTRRRQRMWRRPASLAQLPGRCRRTQAGAPRPRRARPAGRDSGRACAQRAPEAGWARGRGVGRRGRAPARALP